MSKAQRSFWLFLAILFFVTTFAFTFFVIWQSRRDSQASEQAKALQDSINNQTSQSKTCSVDLVSGYQPEANPEVFKPGGDVTTLQTTDLSEGTGTAAKAGDCLLVKYYGTLASDGTKFDGNFDSDKALRFQLGKSSVISGWDNGVVGMKVGGVRRLVIPSDQGYGETGSPPKIPANADLVFVVKLLKISE